jgi:hypothetical protein
MGYGERRGYGETRRERDPRFSDGRGDGDVGKGKRDPRERERERERERGEIRVDGKEVERGEKVGEAMEQPRTLSRLGLAKDYHQQTEPSGGGRFNKFQVRFLEIKNLVQGWQTSQ